MLSSASLPERSGVAVMTVELLKGFGLAVTASLASGASSGSSTARLGACPLMAQTSALSAGVFSPP